jgi:MFS family permease
MATPSPIQPAPQRLTRFAPEAVLIAGCLCGLITFGPRSSLGLFQIPMSVEFGWGRDVFSLAIALQNLMWGLGQPFAGAVADRFGTVRVFILGAVMYAAGLAIMAYAQTPGTMVIGSGVLIGLGLSGCSFNLVLGAFGKILPEKWRGFSFGAGTAAGSFGQFLFPPAGAMLIEQIGWPQKLLVFAGTILLVFPLSLTLSARGTASSTAQGPAQSIPQALAEAFQHRSYVFLVIGFFTCGFHLAFITTHLPAYLKDAGMPAWVGGWTLAAIGLANVVGSLSSGWMVSRGVPKRWILSAIYASRSLVVLLFLLVPVSPASAMAFGAGMGLLWLSTIPPTSSLVALMFGTRYMSMLYGFAFFSHQLGGFLGVWLGGLVYERSGSYELIWWLSILLGVLSALINLPIREQPVVRPVVAAA